MRPRAIKTGNSRGEEIGGVAALLFLLVTSAGLWALALWPLPDETPAWLERVRWVCFEAAPGGLPETSGWLLLIGQPLGLLAVLMVGWGQSVRAGLRWLAAARWGRGLLTACAGGLVVGVAAAGFRVSSVPAGEVVLPQQPLPVGSYPQLDRDAPALDLVDQFGARFDLSRLAGRPALVTFAFGHCETLCPMILRDALEVQRQLRERAARESSPTARIPRVVMVTLDPWRDTPSRLPHLLRRWGGGDDVFLLSGEVETVNGALDRWNVPRERDPKTGDVAHPPLVYVLDASGRIAFAATGGVDTLLGLVDRATSGLGTAVHLPRRRPSTRAACSR